MKNKLPIILTILIIASVVAIGTNVPKSKPLLIPIPRTEFLLYNPKSEVIKSYVREVFASCSTTAIDYLEKINPGLSTSLVEHNYIGNRYFSSNVGLFLLNDSIDETSSYSIKDLQNY